MLEVRSVTRMFGQKAAVDNVSFTIDRPAFVGIIGRSGAGKSTFLRMMNRLTRRHLGRDPGRWPQCAGAEGRRGPRLASRNAR